MSTNDIIKVVSIFYNLKEPPKHNLKTTLFFTWIKRESLIQVYLTALFNFPVADIGENLSK